MRRRIYRKAKSDKTHRFSGLFVHVTKVETLEEAYRIAKSNGGAAGVDCQKLEDIESAGRSGFLVAGQRKRRRKSRVGWRRWSNEYLHDVLRPYWDWKVQLLPQGKGK